MDSNIPVRFRNPDCNEVPAGFLSEGEIPAGADVFRDHVFTGSTR